MLAEEERKIEAQKLRENMRNGRRGKPESDKAGRDTIKNSGSTSGSPRSAGSLARRDSQEPSRNTANVGGNERSTQEQSERVRSDSGRSINHGSGTPIGGYQIAGLSGLERIDPPSETPVKRPVGRPRKEQVVDAAASVKKVFFKKKSVLTEKEADEYKEPLMRALQSYGEYYDRYLRWKTQQTDMPDIWGNITDFEAEAMANIMLRRGMKNAQAAEVVRSMVNGEDYVNVSVMFIPRIMATVEQKKKVPPKERKRKRRENIA